MAFWGIMMVIFAWLSAWWLWPGRFHRVTSGLWCLLLAAACLTMISALVRASHLSGDEVAVTKATAESDESDDETWAADDEAADTVVAESADEVAEPTGDSASEAAASTQSVSASTPAPEAASTPATPATASSYRDPQPAQASQSQPTYQYQPVPETAQTETVYVNAAIPGRYHKDPSCRGLQRYGGGTPMPLSQAQQQGFVAFCAYERYGNS